HRQLGITFIYVTHDQREALIMSDRIAVMNEGRIAQLGSPTDLYDRPADRFVAGFVGESNFLEGEVTRADANAVAVAIAGATVTATCARAPAVGARVALAVRPEKIAFADGADSAGLNAVAAVVREVTFVGEMHRYVLEIGTGTAVVMKQQHRFAVR